MIENKFFRYFFYVTIFISFFVSLNVGFRRYNYEESHKHVQLAMSLRELHTLSLYAGVPLSNTLQTFSDKDELTTIVIEEVTLQDYVDQGQLTILRGSDIMNMQRVGNLNRSILKRLYKNVKPDYLYLIVEQNEDFEHIRDFLKVEFGSDHVTQISRYNILEVLDDREDLMSIGLGIRESDIELVNKYGFLPLIRLKNTNRLSPAVVNQKILSFSRYYPGGSVIFEGDSILGYPTQVSLLSDKLIDKQIGIGTIEFFNQQGLTHLSKKMPYDLSRVHSLALEDQQSVPFQKVVDRYVRAAKERGIGILFLHPYLTSNNETPLLDYNVSFIHSIYEKLQAYGIQIQTMIEYPQKKYMPAFKWEQFIISFSVFTTILLLISFFKSLTFMFVFFYYIVSLFLYQGIQYFFGNIFLHQVMAFLVAVAFPTLAMISQFPSQELKVSFLKKLSLSLIYVSKLIGICLIGSALIVALLSDLVFIQGIERFWMVKLSFIIPLIIIGLFFYLRPHRLKATFFVLRRLYYSPVRTAGLISIFVVFLFLSILIIRSGNYIQIPTLGFEAAVRNWLESVFFVRPRTKEFFIGYPFLFISFLFVDTRISRLWVWFFNLLGAVSLISIINSFCHLHTPLYISLYRTFLGLALGCVVTVIYVLFMRIMGTLIKKVTV